MIIYNKLVRDRIPEIIEADGKKCEVRILNDEEYLEMLNQKLHEELNEYNESGEIEELTDLVEVVYAIAEYKGVNIEEFEKIRNRKRENRGRFKKKLFLVCVDDDDK